MRQMIALSLIMQVVPTLAQDDGTGRAKPIEEKLFLASGKFRKEPTQITRIFRAALSDADLPGGMELAGSCGMSKIELVPNENWSVNDALESIMQSQTYLRREISSEGTVNLRTKAVINGILDIHIVETSILDRQMFVPSVELLIQTPDVLERIRSLGLRFLDESVSGFYKLKRPAPIPVVIRDMTLRQALNTLRLSMEMLPGYILRNRVMG